MQKNIEIEKFMTKCPHSVGLDQNIEVARKLMRNHGFHHLPVLDGGRLVGVISDRDIKFATGWLNSGGAESFVNQVYTPEPYIVEPATALTAVLDHMVREQIGCALIASNGEHLLGIFTMSDACRFLAKYLGQ